MVQFEENDNAGDEVDVPKPQRNLNRGKSRRASIINYDPEKEAQQKAAFREKKWPYSMFRGFETDSAKWVTLLGCTSSAIVLGVRLYLDSYPMAYVIHSIIVFFDMILIHIFTHSSWLSITGEMITYINVILFTLTKESVWELMETVLLAILSSIYMINSRKKVMIERDQKDLDLDSLRERGALLLRNIHQVHSAIHEHHESTGTQMRQSVAIQLEQEKKVLAALEQGTLKDADAKNDDVASTAPTETESTVMADDTELTRELLKPGEGKCCVVTFKNRLDTWLKPFTQKTACNEEMPKKRFCCSHEFRETFFEYFLDGAAGVMYTSFLGLVIDAFMNYGNSPYH